MNLVIVESPTKARTIQRFLSADFKVSSSYGHIRDLPEKRLGIDIENDFKPEYTIPAKAKKQVGQLKKETAKAKNIILATDEDREGEAIAWHLAQVLELDKQKPYQRIVFHEITKSAIEQALKNPRHIDTHLVDAQQARRVLDRIVGYKLSPFLWRKVAKGLSAGRVQSVAVRLVVEREKEIENFKPQEYWEIAALLQTQIDTDNKSFLAKLAKKDGKVIPRLGIKNKEEAEEIIKNLNGAEYAVKDITKKEVKRNPLPPFTTSTLQQEGWKRLRLPARMTMTLAQRLYEKGFITYHRTDSFNLSESALFGARKFIIENYGQNYWAGFLKKYKAKGRVQEAHEAIRPTSISRAPERLKDLEKKEQKLYELIWQRFVACQMAQASFDSTIVEIETTHFTEKKNNPPPSMEEKNNPSLSPPSKREESKRGVYTFRASGQVLKFDGFLKVYPMKFQEANLPPLEKNEELSLIKLEPSQHFTQPPSRYNEASLIKALELEGIGRPSTYAPIISTIQSRNYVEKDEQKKFRPCEIGMVVTDLLIKHFPEIVDIKFTARLEEELDEIAQGKKRWTPVMQEFYGPFAENLNKKYQEVQKKEIAQEPTDRKCPRCGGQIIIRLGKFGKFYACSNFPKCRFTENITESIGVNCPKCTKGQIVEKRTKKGKIFYGCNNYPKCNFALWDKPINEKCPKCGSLMVMTKRKIIKCSNKECEKKESSGSSNKELTPHLSKDVPKGQKQTSEGLT